MEVEEVDEARAIVDGAMKGFSRRTPESRAYISAKKTPGMTLDDTTGQIDMRRLRAYRMGRVQAELQKRDYCAALLFDPINVRYATGTRNMAVWLLHNPARYCLVPAEGAAILFEYGNKNCRGMSAGLETIGQLRTAVGCQYFYAAEHMEQVCRAFADDVADALKDAAGANSRLAVDRIDPGPARALEALGIGIFDGQEPCERARAIKGPEEIACMAVAMAACDTGMARMREALKPGITENRLWAELHHANIALGGEWIETRLLSSGGRTNPWFQESSDRVIRPGDLVSFDTDLIGPYGYCADVSRTFFCGPGRPSRDQRTLYSLAYEQIHSNMELLRPGASFDELREKAWKVPARFEAQKYSSIYHGVGLCDEWPAISYASASRRAQGGVVEPGMVLCVESYIGEESGAEGVKLEEQVLITENGPQLLSTFPFEEALSG